MKKMRNSLKRFILIEWQAVIFLPGNEKITLEQYMTENLGKKIKFKIFEH